MTTSKGPGVAFLLTQLGTLAAQRFADRVGEFDLTPPQVGLLRAIATGAGRSQQALAGELGLVPSRVVAFLDELEQRGFVERRRNPDDRRLHALHLTGAGRAVMNRVGAAAKAHEAELTAGLSAAEREQLRSLLGALASARGLSEGIHPGYRTMGTVRR